MEETLFAAFFRINILVYLWLIAWRLRSILDELKNINNKNK